MDAGTALIVGQCVAGVLFIVSEVLGSTKCNYNSIFDLVMSVISGVFVKPVADKPPKIVVTTH